MRRSIEVLVAANVMRIELDATAFVKWENRARAANVPLAILLSLFLTDEVQRTR